MKIIAKRVSIFNGIIAFLTRRDTIIQNIQTKLIVLKEKLKNTQQDAKRRADIVQDKRNLNLLFVVHLIDLVMACATTRTTLLIVRKTFSVSKVFFFCNFCLIF